MRLANYASLSMTLVGPGSVMGFKSEFTRQVNRKALELAIRSQFDIQLTQQVEQDMIDFAVEQNWARPVDVENYGCYCRFDQILDAQNEENWTIKPKDQVDNFCSHFKDANLCLRKSNPTPTFAHDPNEKCDAVIGIEHGYYRT